MKVIVESPGTTFISIPMKDIEGNSIEVLKVVINGDVVDMSNGLPEDYQNIQITAEYYIPGDTTHILFGTSSYVTSNGNCKLIVPEGITSIAGFNVMVQPLSELELPSTLVETTGTTLSPTNTSIFSMYNESCSGFTSVVCKATVPPIIGTNSFSYTDGHYYRNFSNLNIYVPAASVDTYKAASGWSKYTSRIQAIS